MDALSDVLRAVSLTGAVFFDIRASEPWIAVTPRGPSIVEAMFPGAEHLICYHVITGGRCWAYVPGGEPMQVAAGDIICFPHGDSHILASDPSMNSEPDVSRYHRPDEGQLPFRISMGGNAGDASPESAHIICGFLGCDARPYNPLLSALPQVIRVNGNDNAALNSYVQLALAESRSSRPGAQSVLSRLSELMFVDMVRAYLETLPDDRTGWLAGLRDAYIGRALTALHKDPSRGWSLETLAQVAGLSRSAFAERFTQFVGTPPMHYLAHWRMQLAANQLLSSKESVANVAVRVGYESEAAFSRAFKKSTGVAPSEWRRVRRQVA